MKRLFALITICLLAAGADSQWLGNDDCSTAVPLTVGAPCITGDNSLATSALDYSMNCAFGGDATQAAVWFSFVCPPSGGVTISTDYAATTFDTQINLIGAAAGDPTLCPATMFEYCCSEDAGVTVPLAGVMSTGGLVPGQTYYIQLDGYAGATGTFCIDVVEIPYAPDVGTFTVNVTGGSTVVVGDTIWVCDNTISCFEVVSNNDFVLPPPECGELSELMYAIYSCPPTTGDPPGPVLPIFPVLSIPVKYRRIPSSRAFCSSCIWPPSWLAGMT